MVTAVDVAGRKKWSATVPGDQYTGQPTLTCAPGQVISAADGPEIGEGTLAMLNASNGRTLFTTRTVTGPQLQLTSGQLVITGLDQSNCDDNQSVLKRYR